MSAVTVVGSLNQDLVVRVPHHPVPGETVLGAGHFVGLGGKGANQAVAAARLGADVAMVGAVGADDAGDQLLAGLGAAGVDHATVRRDPDAPTGLAMITVDDSAENAIVVSPGANAGLGSHDIHLARRRIATSEVVLAQLEIPLDAVAAAAATTTGRFILNPAPAPARPLPASLLEATSILVPNRTELGRLAGVPQPKARSEVVNVARSLAFAGVVVVTLGDEGAVVIDDSDAVVFDAPSVRPVDTTGAGDAFCGALAEGLARGLELGEAVEWAVHAGAYAVTGLGAQAALPTAIQVRALLGDG